MSSLLLIMALLAPAHAFAPIEADDGLGIEPSRIRTNNPIRQRALARQPAWEEFLVGEGKGWAARFDERTGSPHRMWGRLDLGPVADAAQVEAALRALIARQPGLFGTNGADLIARNVAYVASRDTWFIDLDRVVRGAAIWRGGVTARFERGALVMVGVDTYADVPTTDRGAVSRADAIGFVRAWDRLSGQAVDVRGVHPYAVPEESDDGLVLRLVWQVDLRSEPISGGLPGEWHVMVDQADGALVAAWNDVRPVTGTLSGSIYARHRGSAVVTRPMPLARVRSSDGTVYTDALGAFSTAGTSEGLTADLEGAYVRLRNDAGDEGSLAFAGSDAIWTTANATQAELSTYIFLHDVQAWGAAYGPDRDWVGERIRANVNRNEVCNAFFDPGSNSVNFYSAGSGCNNTGEIADVVYHEWGHGFHWSSVVAGVLDGSIGEGAGDTIAGFLTRDPVMAPYFFTNGSGIREVATNRVYPDDFNPDPNYVHSNGLIFAGAFWDLTTQLVTELGETEGRRVAQTLFAEMLRGGPDIETSYDETILADDDNGDLSDGTPHQCAIVDAFALHGLGPAGAGGAAQALVLDPPVWTRAGVDHVIPGELFDLAPGCLDFVPKGGEVVWRANGGTWQRTPFSTPGTDVEVVIPAQPEGTFVEYYATITGSIGETVTAPTGGDINPFSFYVGEVIELACFDFEADDGGFTHELLSGVDEDGADDWMWGLAVGLSGDPTTAASGASTWGNDLGGGRYNGAYKPDRVNRLTSVAVDTTDYAGTFLAYSRWLTVEDGFYDHANLYADDAEIWTNHDSRDGDEHHLDDQWAPHVLSLAGAGEDGSVQVAWEIESDPGLSLGGWNIDDVCIYAPATPNNRLRIGDFQASDGGEQVVLTWTQPRHAPITRVIVVRSPDGFPAGPTGGEVVVDVADVTPLTPVSIIDEGAPRGVDLFYAVYAYDGTRWLETTLEGQNADQGSRLADANVDEAIGKCGCQSAGSPAWGALAAVGALLLRRRRRG